MMLSKWQPLWTERSVRTGGRRGGYTMGGWVGFLAGKGNAEGGNKHRMHSTQEDCQCKTAASEICVSLGVHIYS